MSVVVTPITKFSQFRDAIQNGVYETNMWLDKISIDEWSSLIKETMTEGKVIDFGNIPISNSNEVQTPTSEEVLDKYIHPFDNWIGLVKGYNNLIAGFQVKMMHQGIKQYAVLTFWTEFVDNVAVVWLSDLVICSEIVGFNFKEMNNTEWENKHDDRLKWSFATVLLMLRILNDASVPVEHVPAPERLNKQRIKNGKQPIPAHTVVHTKDYVSAITNPVKGKQSESKGGTHASPIAHWRRAHVRTMSKTGKIVQVSASRVNWRGPEELHRLFYKVDPNANSTRH